MGEISDTVADELRGIANRALYADVLTAATERVREHLLGFDTDTGVALATGDAADPAVPSCVPQLLRAGTARVSALRIVDAFGRTLSRPTDRHSNKSSFPRRCRCPMTPVVATSCCCRRG